MLRVAPLGKSVQKVGLFRLLPPLGKNAQKVGLSRRSQSPGQIVPIVLTRKRGDFSPL
jgi:hypothetical protein